MQHLKYYMKKAFHTFNQMEMRILPGNLAFFFVLALLPIITMVIAISSSFGISMDSVISLVKQIVPGDAGQSIIEVISGRGFDGLIGTFNVIAFVYASNGTYAIVNASNTLYHVEGRDSLKDRIKSIILLFILLWLILFLIFVPLFGNKILFLISKYFAVDKLQIVYNFLKWPLSIFMIYMNLKLIYTIAPSKRIQSNSTTYGAMFTTIIWTLATFIFSFYLDHFAHYNVIYGNLSSMIILMMWLYIISYVFVMGMAINVTQSEDK